MAIIGWYYLHINGDLIYKRELGDTAADIRESDMARMLWPIDPTNRATAWRILVEALALGANRQRINDLVEKWGCNNKDAHNYADYCGLNLFQDGNSWCATRQDFINLQESPSGFGDTCLEAMADLCKSLGYRPSKMWGASFEDLVRGNIGGQ
ncbi:hypothetical protein [Anaeroselena agilis]|uniref:Uncharacterized protein n=1 Tax=Anaeroselena agilis TaxID=3063788 RepID=A0ABU3NVS9_9FIRM|nr:hypothetical protein [Selenomonadales bacterium 4137-cl]